MVAVAECGTHAVFDVAVGPYTTAENTLAREVIDQVELFFSILQRKVITRGNFAFREDLVTKLLGFIADYDQTAKPFRWTYAADPLRIA